MLAKKVKIQKLSESPKLIAGFDVQECEGNIAIGVLVVFDYQTMDIIDEVKVKSKIHGEYKSGFLAIRELPLFLEAWKDVRQIPDVTVFDGHGIMHPRGLGLASHAGVMINKPTFGIAKKPIFHDFDQPDNIAGNWTEIVEKEIVVGACLRTKIDTKPVFVSAGNKITLQESIDIAMKFVKYRIPEITRRPDSLVRKYCRELKI